jgi:hypothetical protein
MLSQSSFAIMNPFLLDPIKALIIFYSLIIKANEKTLIKCASSKQKIIHTMPQESAIVEVTAFEKSVFYSKIKSTISEN